MNHPPLDSVSLASHEYFMERALKQAQLAPVHADVPIGAVIVDKNNTIIAQTHNQREHTHDPSAHAELLAIQEACKTLGTDRLENCTLYTTLEPCPMCAGATILAHIPRLVIGAWDDKTGAAGSVLDIVRHRNLNHFTEVIGNVKAKKSADLLQTFFHTRRKDYH